MPGERALWLDVARGGALIAMIVYHFAVDLALFQLVDWPVMSALPWRLFAAAIASTFVFAAGVSLAYAHAGGMRWRAFLRRIAVLAAAAAAVTAATMVAMPQGPIFFGILHAIATFSILALAFLWAPVWLSFAGAAVLFVLPHMAKHAIFASPLFYPLGLSPVPPVTMDYEPIVPWFAVTLLGVAAGRLVPAQYAAPRGRVDGALAWLGRHTLVIYLVHQPVLFAGLIAFQRVTA
ncbi:MAG: heparan-alpha-glucosaminide N-acetyltransferase [Pseudomonadota bacterium]